MIEINPDDGNSTFLSTFKHGRYIYSVSSSGPIRKTRLPASTIIGPALFALALFSIKSYYNFQKNIDDVLDDITSSPYQLFLLLH